VRGYRDALTWVTYLAGESFFAHGETVLSALHFMMMRFWPERRPGRYRRSGTVVTGDDPLAPSYVGPAAEDVPALMRELVGWLNEGDLDTHVLVRTAIAHARVVSALYAAATGQLRRGTYQQDESLSRDQAIRDIRRLEGAGLVEAVGYGATLYYIAAGAARAIAEDVAVRYTAPTDEPYG
jgi:Fic family protein